MKSTLIILACLTLSIAGLPLFAWHSCRSKTNRGKYHGGHGYHRLHQEHRVSKNFYNKTPQYHYGTHHHDGPHTPDYKPGTHHSEWGYYSWRPGVGWGWWPKVYLLEPPTTEGKESSSLQENNPTNKNAENPKEEDPKKHDESELILIESIPESVEEFEEIIDESSLKRDNAE